MVILFHCELNLNPWVVNHAQLFLTMPHSLSNTYDKKLTASDFGGSIPSQLAYIFPSPVEHGSVKCTVEGMKEGRKAWKERSHWSHWLGKILFQLIVWYIMANCNSKYLVQGSYLIWTQVAHWLALIEVLSTVQPPTLETMKVSSQNSPYSLKYSIWYQLFTGVMKFLYSYPLETWTIIQ